MQTHSTSIPPVVNASPLDQIFQDLFKVNPADLKNEFTMGDIELWDSLRHMELIVAVEQAFNIELSFDEIATMQSIGAIRDLVAAKTGK